MIQVDDGRSMYATKVLRIEPRFEFSQSNLHQIRCVAYMQLYIIIGPDQPCDFSNPNVHDPATAIPDEQAKQMLDWFCFQRRCALSQTEGSGFPFESTKRSFTRVNI